VHTVVADVVLLLGRSIDPRIELAALFFAEGSW
jgi:hypothetical protein